MQSLHFELQEEGLKKALDDIAKRKEKDKEEGSRFSVVISVDVTPNGEEVEISNRRVEIVKYPKPFELASTNDA